MDSCWRGSGRDLLDALRRERLHWLCAEPLGPCLGARLTRPGHGVKCPEQLAGLRIPAADVAISARAGRPLAVAAAGNDDVAENRGRRLQIVAAVAQIAQRRFSVEKVIARVLDPRRAAWYAEQGVQTICPTQIAIEQLEQAALGES